MAFTFTLDSNELSIRGASKEDEELITFDIGYDDETHSTYKVLVALTPVTAHPRDYREQYFILLEAKSDESSDEFSDGLHTKRFLSDDCRAEVLRAISFVAFKMVERCAPNVLIINTIQTYLPDKALTKYDVICEAICCASYSCGKVNSYHGSEQWQLVKN